MSEQPEKREREGSDDVPSAKKQEIDAASSTKPLFLVMSRIVSATYDVYITVKQRLFWDKDDAIEYAKELYVKELDASVRGGAESIHEVKGIDKDTIEELGSDMVYSLWRCSDTSYQYCGPHAPLVVEVSEMDPTEKGFEKAPGEVLYRLPRQEDSKFADPAMDKAVKKFCKEWQ
eukprot:TRINITY_DN63053_c0_g2_i1.p2 TRINITY_DN63053_c0_g2~~TRINITY_DN63053_c0_g2_i1.p2  ORF type:complete len:175 (+),score=21.43 TRINITY_DN63053_c0_g2_i1:21-545(+)